MVVKGICKLTSMLPDNLTVADAIAATERMHVFFGRQLQQERHHQKDHQKLLKGPTELNK